MYLKFNLCNLKYKCAFNYILYDMRVFVRIAKLMLSGVLVKYIHTCFPGCLDFTVLT